ncbi:hypothetical protein RHSIM_Rhsim02G0046300 [Rhododendron simsii]|uniref:EF-hand domain-containing protein n=1 Tax=Rhododendron simsii TaxID=118357 RepID=A0A834LS57_RHOSS|nr:hypothetical protein RHSIM_Rhsim02G0046300 [Rhododendron simsii]
MAYYANMPKDQQKKLLKFYKSLDKDGDGKVSIHEYMDFLVRKGLTQHVPPNLFKLLDKDGGGTLDFEESITLFYMFTCSRLVICDGCQSYLWGVHFLCVKCYNADKVKTYNLCCSCYRNKNFTHEHSSFMDNYALLRAVRVMVTYY